jgi:hypothetical protein
MDKRIFDALAAGVPVITRGGRLARAIRTEFDALQRARGLTAWPSASVMPWSSRSSVRGGAVSIGFKQSQIVSTGAISPTLWSNGMSRRAVSFAKRIWPRTGPVWRTPWWRVIADTTSIR